MRQLHWLAGVVLSLLLVGTAAQSPSPSTQPTNQPTSNSLGIWAAPMQPGWPTIMAAVLPSTLKLSSQPVFEWTFPTDTVNQTVCTMFGVRNMSPCRGNMSVVDHTFSTVGVHTINVVITDSTLSQPLRTSASVTITSIRDVKRVYRPEIRQLDQTGMNRTIWGLYRLMQLGVYSHIARIHYLAFVETKTDGSARSAAHAGPSFLPWHRMSMRIIEVCMQTALNYPDYALPYFEWKQGWTGMEAYVGPFGSASNGGIVQSGPFCNDPAQVASPTCPKLWVLPPDFPDPVKGIRRLTSSKTSFHFQTSTEYDALMNITAYDEYPFNSSPTQNSFRNALEGWAQGKYGTLHNGFHMWMGGTMSKVEISFYDPMFLFHHVQVDRLFTDWQKRHSCADGRATAACYRPGDSDPDVNENTPGVMLRTNDDGTTTWVLDGAMYNDQMYPWNMRASELLQAEVGYSYLAPDVKPEQIPDPVANPPNIFGATKPAVFVARSGVAAALKPTMALFGLYSAWLLA